MDFVEITISHQRDYFKIYDLILKKKKLNVTLVLRKSFLEPIDVLILTGFFIHQLALDNRTKLIAINNATEDYIQAIGLVDFCKGNYTGTNTIGTISKYTAMPIERLARERMPEYISATQQYFQNFFLGKDLGMLNVVLAELLNNAYDHAHSDLGAYVFCQYYPNIGAIKISVADFGIGIPHSVNNYRLTKKEKELSQIDSVKWAVKENMTTKSIPQNMGKGLDLLNTFMKSSGNRWQLYSDDVLLRGGSPSNRYEENPIAHFKGTIAQISIQVESLQDKAEENDFDW